MAEGYTWAPKVCKVMAFIAIIMGLGLLFYILLDLGTTPLYTPLSSLPLRNFDDRTCMADCSLIQGSGFRIGLGEDLGIKDLRLLEFRVLGLGLGI